MPVPSSEKIVFPYKVVCNTCTDSEVRLSTIDIYKDGVSKKKYNVNKKRNNLLRHLCYGGDSDLHILIEM